MASTTSSPSPTTPLNIAVIGATGFGGSWLTKELISRGHRVTGLSRHPEKLGIHPLYTPKQLDITSDITVLAAAFAGFDVIVDEYGPHAAGFAALKYMPFLEVTRRVILAIKLARVPYFIKVGGTGSLHLPGQPHVSVLESPQWWLDYRRGIADSHAHVTYMEERLGPSGVALRGYRNARLALKAGTAGEVEEKVIKTYEQEVKNRDAAMEFVTACRTSFMFFEGRADFAWSFVSPSSLYRPGKRTGVYMWAYDVLPLKGDRNSAEAMEGRLHGISVADLAVAIADEAEERRHVGRHWTAWADLSDDTPAPSYVRIDE